jgi:hypothetical protein
MFTREHGSPAMTPRTPGTGRAALVAAIACAAVTALGMPIPPAAANAGASTPPRPGPTAEKMAVLVLAAADGQSELADNVTEVVIGFVARRNGAEIAGKEEFRGRLGVTGDRQAALCMDELSCLARAAVSLGVRRIVSGHVSSRGKQFHFNLALNNVETGKVESRVFRLIEGGPDELVRAVTEASEELFRPRVEPGRIHVRSDPQGARVSIDNAYLGVTPLVSGTLLAGKHHVRVEADGRFPWLSQVDVLPGQELGINLGATNLPRRRRWPGVVAYGGAGLGAVAGAAGGFLGVLSQLTPNGNTRAEIQRDVDQKHRLAMGANAAFITAGALAAVSLVHFIVFRGDIFGQPVD